MEKLEIELKIVRSADDDARYAIWSRYRAKRVMKKSRRFEREKGKDHESKIVL